MGHLRVLVERSAQLPERPAFDKPDGGLCHIALRDFLQQKIALFSDPAFVDLLRVIVAATIHAPQQPIGGVNRIVGIVVLARQLIGARQHDRPHELLERPALLLHEGHRQLIEQLAGDSEADERSQQEARLLAERFQQALLTLKSTKLGGQGGQRMLYQLPWYMFIGAPGSGKGTQAETVSRELKLPHVASGDLFRDNLRQATELGRLAKGYMDRGELVPDEIVQMLTASGTPAEARAKVQEYIDHGCTCPILYPLGDVKAMIDAFAPQAGK